MEIRKAITQMLSELGITDVHFSVEHPADPAHGEYASNVAMVCAKNLEKNPREVAGEFQAALEGKIPHVSLIEIAGPGFINFRLTRDFFSEKIACAHSSPETWGTNDSLKGEEIIFEYTSPNLFKPLHVGNLVGNIVGESLSRLLENSGALVRRVNYPSDIGLTVAKGVWGLMHTKGNPQDINQIGEAYRAGNELYENGEGKEEIEAVNRALYRGDDESLNTLRAQGIATSRARLAELCRLLGTKFDTEIFESEVGERGTQIVKEHIGDVFEESNGAVIFRGERHGLHTRVFLNSQGLPTYEAKDLGNFAKKLDVYPTWTQSYVVTGGEQREYFKVLVSALREVFPDTKGRVIAHIPTGFLTLTTGKMSSRKGNVLTGESLIAEVQEEARHKAEESRADDIEALTENVAVGALKYQILRQSVGSDIVFDKTRALSLEGDSGPYLQYAHARITSILEKARAQSFTPSAEHPPENPYPLEKVLYRFPEVIRLAQTDLSPHHLVVYLTELASAFNSFYAQETIIDTNDEYTPYKLALTSAVRETLNRGLYLLGIIAPKYM